MSTKIAMTDMDIVWEDKEANKKQCIAMVQEAAEQNADYILFPEMTLTGFSLQVDIVKDTASETIDFFSGLARDFSIAIGFGYVLKPDDMGRNHFCLVDQTGTVIVDYEKIHPFSYGGEDEVYRGGDSVRHFRTGELVCGVAVCYDLRFPEMFQQMPMDTNVVFLIANWPESRVDHWYALLKARAIEMPCYIVGINRTGSDGGLTYTQSSAAFAPNGCRLPETTGKWNRYVELDFDEKNRFVHAFPSRRDRRPEAYHA